MAAGSLVIASVGIQRHPFSPLQRTADILPVGMTGRDGKRTPDIPREVGERSDPDDRYGGGRPYSAVIHDQDTQIIRKACKIVMTEIGADGVMSEQDPPALIGKPVHYFTGRRTQVIVAVAVGGTEKYYVIVPPALLILHIGKRIAVKASDMDGINGKYTHSGGF